MFKKSRRITSPDHTFFDAHYYSCSNEHADIVVVLPAMGVNSQFYEALAEYLTSLDYHVVTFDWRGMGSSSVRASWEKNFGFFEIIEYDLQTLLSDIRQLKPNNRLFILGHSLGGQVACLFNSLSTYDVAGLLLIASGAVWHKGFPKPFKTLFQTQFILALTHLFGYLPGEMIKFGYREPRQLVREWARCARHGKYIIDNSTHNYEQALQESSTPVFALTFDGDALAPRASMENLLNKMPKSTIQHQHTHSEALNIDSVSHFSWAKQPHVFAPIFDNWMQSI